MKNIQELLALKNHLETEINKLDTDPAFTVLQGRLEKLTNMKNTHQGLLVILQHFALLQFVFGDKISEKQVFEWINEGVKAPW